MKTLSQIFESIKIQAKTAEFIPTGLAKFDAFLDGGFLKKELIVLGGYTGTGKSFLSGQFLFHAAHEGFKCAYFSLEISNEMIVSRLIGAESNLSPTLIKTGKIIDPFENRAKIDAQVRLSTYEEKMVFVDDVYQLEGIIKIIRENEFEFVVIDFVQNVMERGDEYERLSKIALSFQKLAKEKNCCILVVSQLSNEAFKTGALEYKGSGSIATVCDLGLFLTKDEENVGVLELKIKKNRRGISGKAVGLQSVYPGGKFHEL